MEQFDIVKLKKADKKHGVKAGCIGTIVETYEDGKFFTVEFADEEGDTILDALNTEYSEKELELVKAFRTMDPPAGVK